jgi:hypothetical protein
MREMDRSEYFKDLTEIGDISVTVPAKQPLDSTKLLLNC